MVELNTVSSASARVFLFIVLYPVVERLVDVRIVAGINSGVNRVIKINLFEERC